MTIRSAALSVRSTPGCTVELYVFGLDDDLLQSLFREMIDEPTGQPPPFHCRGALSADHRRGACAQYDRTDVLRRLPTVQGRCSPRTLRSAGPCLDVELRKPAPGIIRRWQSMRQSTFLSPLCGGECG